MVFAMYQHESATDVHVSPHPESPHLPSHPIPLGCPRAPALGALLHASNLHWSSISHKVIYMFQCYSLISSTLSFSHIYTMEHCSATKKTTFESVLMRWMKLEPIKQSEVSQKEKHQYHILTHPLFRNCGYFLLVRNSSSVQSSRSVVSSCL